MPTTFEVQDPQVDGGVQVQEPITVPQVQELWQPPLLPERPLFADSLLDSGRPDRKRRTLATTISFAMECLLIGVLVIVPLMFTDALPTQQLLTLLVAPPPPPPPPPAAQAVTKVVRQIQSELLNNGQLRTPSRIPAQVQMIREEEAPALPSTGGVVGGVPGGIPGGQLGGVLGGIISHTSTLPIVPRLAPPPKPIRISQGVTQGMLIHRVEPTYPPLARQARIEGQVLLKAIIAKDGSIKELALVSGHPMLAPAAIEAVKEWRFRPFLLNGEPVEVETSVTVTFKFLQ